MTDLRLPLIQRRAVLLTGGAGLVTALGGIGAAAAAESKTEARFTASPFRKISDADWKKRLPPKSYTVLRKEDTEYPGTSPLLKEHRKGTFVCLGCDLPLFNSATKYESHTGWPSFFRAIDANISGKTDFKIGVPRNEYHCAQCLGHQGHVFKDGPPQTGLRYCKRRGAEVRARLAAPDHAGCERKTASHFSSTR